MFNNLVNNHNLDLVGDSAYKIIFGHTEIADTTNRLMWHLSSAYTFLSTAATLYASSSNAADNQTITVIGLDADWKEQTQTVVLNGQNQVAISGTWIRVNLVSNEDTTATAGNVYIAESDTLTAGVPNTASKIKSYMESDSQRSHQALYSIPANRTGYLQEISLTAGTNQTMSIGVHIRKFNGVFQQHYYYNGLSNAINEDILTAWVKLEPKTDVMIKTKASSGSNGQASAEMVIYLRS